MKYYDGRRQDDSRPIGGGSWNKEHEGGELCNFKKTRGRHYGFCQPSGNSNNIKLEKIEPEWQGDRLPGVTVVFVAVNREDRRHRQCVVGWYRNAVVYRFRQSSQLRRRECKEYFAVARVADSVLLDTYKRDWPAKAGQCGIGESNVCYLYDDHGRRKSFAWQNRILKRIENYRRW